MKAMLLFLLLPLASCGVVDTMAQYGYDKVATGEMTFEDYGKTTFYSVGAERQAKERYLGGFDLLGLLGDLGLAGGAGGAVGLALVRMLRGSPLKSGSGDKVA